MKSVYKIFLSLIPIICNSQIQTVNNQYLSESKDLVDYIIKNELKISSFVLSDRTTTYDLKDCFESNFSKNDELTESEKIFIKNQIDNPKILKWDNSIIQNTKIISNDSINSFFSENKDGWKEIHKKYGYEIVRLSSPIFFRNYSVCIISYSVTSGKLSGVGYTQMFRKENGIWKWYGWACSWDS